ncbi:MAG: helix-turn-helix domain-containing protein [Candidatus Dormibacteria bacterium]
MSQDFLDELVAERAAVTPDFPAMVDARVETRRLLRALADKRRALGLSQAVVAARMGTSQPALARIEGGEVDPRMSTIERLANALGEHLEHQTATSA